MFGGGKTLRDGLGTNGCVTAAEGALDFVITNALVVDAVQGIVKGDIGIKDGRIVGDRQGGQPADVMDGVHPELVVGANTDVRSAEGMIVDGRGDRRARALRQRRAVRGGDLGRGDDDDRRRAGPGHGRHLLVGHRNLTRMLQAAEDFPLNFGFLGKGSASAVEPLLEQIRAGAIGLKIHEDWGAMPAVIHASLDAADELDVQLQIHTDTLNESGFFERTIAAIGGRTIHTYHSEGAGGGHAPDIIRVSGRGELSAVLDESDEPVHAQHVRRAPRHGDGLPSPQPARYPRTSRSRSRASGARRSPPRTCCTTSGRSA